jgi:hypothetical protein
MKGNAFTYEVEMASVNYVVEHVEVTTFVICKQRAQSLTVCAEDD